MLIENVISYFKSWVVMGSGSGSGSGSWLWSGLGVRVGHSYRKVNRRAQANFFEYRDAIKNTKTNNLNKMYVNADICSIQY